MKVGSKMMYLLRILTMLTGCSKTTKDVSTYLYFYDFDLDTVAVTTASHPLQSFIEAYFEYVF